MSIENMNIGICWKDNRLKDWGNRKQAKKLNPDDTDPELTRKRRAVEIHQEKIRNQDEIDLGW